MKNKFKWFVKKVLIFINYPNKYPVFSRDKFKIAFLHTIYENKRLIKKNYSKYKELNVDNISKFDFSEITKNSIDSSSHLNKSLNNDYFGNLNKYGYGYKVIEYSKYINLDILNNFHLYPANIFVINEIKKLMNDGEIGQGLIVDYPSGIGNLLIYLMKFYNKENLYGIDNFEQISKKDVDQYQNLVGENFKILTYENFKNISLNKIVDVVVCIELHLDIILNSVLEMNSKFLIIETMYISRYKDILKKLDQIFNIYLINESIVIFKRKTN
tara:strand:+ start:288 stop:1100 length:813 start_codon:yes stop_codon:yes gene_type:complete